MTLITRTLGEICDEVGGIIRTGPFGSQLHRSDYQDEGIPVVMPKDIIDNKVSTSTIARVSKKHVERLSQHQLQPGDIIYGRRGDIGRRALITEKETGWLCGTGCLRLSLGHSILEPTFLYYYLGDSQIIAWIYNQAVGATMPNLNTAILRRIPITYPPLPTQHKIAGFLSVYDDLIANNTRRIALLEEMAQTIYREWFVEFHFPGHEEVEIVETAQGRRPEGWEVKKLRDVMTLAYGKALRKRDRKGGPIPVYGSSGIIGNHDQSLVNGPGIIVGRKGNVGRVFWSEEDFYPIDTTFYVVTDVSLYYVYYNLQYQNFINNDAAVPGLSRNQAYLLPFLLPNQAVLIHFKNMVSPIFKGIKLLSTKNATLRETRDLLLPKLIAGELEVEELEHDSLR